MSAVNHPNHYDGYSVECIDAIESALTKDEFDGFCKGNILKYVWREGDKNGTEDLEKAKWYLDKLIETRNGRRLKKDTLLKYVFGSDSAVKPDWTASMLINTNPSTNTPEWFRQYWKETKDLERLIKEMDELNIPAKSDNQRKIEKMFCDYDGED